MAYRIDDKTAVSLLPSPKTTGTGQPGFFTAGDPQTGEGATVVTDDWLNMVQEELVGVVQAAGIALDKTDRGQLLAAIRKFVNASLPVNNPAVQGTLTVNRVVSTDNGGDDLNLLYGPGLASRFSFQRDGNTVLYKNGTAFFSLNEGGAFLGGNRVITTADLAVETARAMAAEAAALPASNPAVQGTLTVNRVVSTDNGGDDLNLLYGPGLASRFSFQRDGNTVLYKSGVAFFSLNEGGAFLGGSRVITTADLAVETARAMGAEAASLPVNNPAVQGTLTAGIFAAPGNGSQNLNVLYGPGLSYRLAGQNDGNLVAYVNNSPFLSISPKGMTFNGNTMATAGDLAALAARMQPMGNYVTAGNRGPTKTYNFDVVAAHGDWISFPDPFSGDAVAVVPVAQDTGNNQIHTSSWFRKDRSGFQLSCNVWTGSTWANEHNGVPVAVAVTGPA